MQAASTMARHFYIYLLGWSNSPSLRLRSDFAFATLSAWRGAAPHPITVVGVVVVGVAVVVDIAPRGRPRSLPRKTI